MIINLALLVKCTTWYKKAEREEKRKKHPIFYKEWIDATSRVNWQHQYQSKCQCSLWGLPGVTHIYTANLSAQSRQWWLHGTLHMLEIITIVMMVTMMMWMSSGYKPYWTGRYLSDVCIFHQTCWGLEVHRQTSHTFWAAIENTLSPIRRLLRMQFPSVAAHSMANSRTLVMGDSPEKKTIRFDSVSNSIQFDSIQYSQSAHIFSAGR